MEGINKTSMMMQLNKLLVSILVLSCVLPAAASSSSIPQRLWTLPQGAAFTALSERPNGRLGIYWYGNPSKHVYTHVQYSRLDRNGKSLGSGEVPGHYNTGNGIALEDWNSRGQHAFLPQCDGSDTSFVRLKTGHHYRALRNLPRLDERTLQDLRFSPDGECLYLLGNAKLWIVGAQSGRLIKVVKPRSGQGWSNENAALSPDCERILGMRGKMTLFSTRNGQPLRRFGKSLKTLVGSCASMEARVSFSRDGQQAVASMEDIYGYETWAYPASGGALRWHGRTPYDILETSRGHFFLDERRISDMGAVSTMLRRWRDGQVGWHLNLNFERDDYDMSTSPFLVFSRDGRWIYFVRNKSVWRVAMPRFPAKR
jgi:hypothetical protein